MRRPGGSALPGVFLLALCAFLAWIAAHELWAFVDGVASGAGWIDVNTGSAGAVPAATAIGCWAAVLLGLRLTDRAERRLMGLSFACVPLIVLLPLAFMVLADGALSDRGYERCRVEAGRRFVGTRYHRGTPQACP